LVNGLAINIGLKRTLHPGDAPRTAACGLFIRPGLIRTGFIRAWPSSGLIAIEFEPPLNSAYQFGWMDGLEQQIELLTGRREYFPHLIGLGLSGQEQHFAIWAAFPHLNRKFDPRKRLHRNIRNQQIRNLIARRCQCFNGLRERFDNETLPAQNHCDCVGDDLFIVNDENALLIDADDPLLELEAECGCRAAFPRQSFHGPPRQPPAQLPVDLPRPHPRRSIPPGPRYNSDDDALRHPAPGHDQKIGRSVSN
jgi:hypothetical protein